MAPCASSSGSFSRATAGSEHAWQTTPSAVLELRSSVPEPSSRTRNSLEPEAHCSAENKRGSTS